MDGQQAALGKPAIFSQINITSFIGSNSLYVKIISAALLICYFLSFSSAIFDHLAVIPGYVLPPNFWIWTLITHSFIQSHIFMVLVDVCVVTISGKLLEPLWGPLEIGIYFLLVTAVSAAVTSFIFMFAYYFSDNTYYVFNVHIYGLGAYVGGFCVAVKQLMPDHVLLKLPFGKIRNKHIPLICLVLAAILSVSGVLNKPYPLHMGFGMLIGWIYLRFYQRHSNGGKGDLAEEFSFSSFFPSPLNLPVAIVSNTLFTLLVKMKVCKKPQRKYDVSAPTTITVTLPGTDPADAERRRQIAIKALNERLSKTTDEGNWPELGDEADETDSNTMVPDQHESLEASIAHPSMPQPSAFKAVQQTSKVEPSSKPLSSA